MREVELKGVAVDERTMRETLDRAQAARSFSGSMVDRRYDTPSFALWSRDEVLRIRITGNGPTARARMDYKGAASYPDGFKVRDEIVAFGAPGELKVDENGVIGGGVHLKPEEVNKLVEERGDEVVFFDGRNAMEAQIGKFKNAVVPDVRTTHDFIRELESGKYDWMKDKPVVSYCTGGIRCEKATAFMKQEGFDEVYHLKGGILKYLEDVPEEESLWEGACFVFDERVSVVHDLREGDHKLCRACRNPLTPEAMASPQYEAGVSCPACYEVRSEDDRKRFREREKQARLARERGQRHMGT